MARLIERLEQEGSAPLEAYGHQVGGHHLLVKYEKDTICKPMSGNSKEYQFYETVSPELRLFTPNYHGVITVSMERRPSGELKIIGYPKRADSTGNAFTCSTRQSIQGGEDSITSKASDGEGYVSPWSSQCKRIAREKLETLVDGSSSFQADYLVLENLTSRFIAPSVLDVKVGTRQHGDDAPLEKVMKHTQTCANSTSATLGVRICGMQKYDAAQNEYIFRDKYYGRGLSEEGFREELQFFLHNGVQFRADLLTDVIAMLEELVKVVQRQDSYRFFSSSLLIIYDGAECPEKGCGSTRTNGTATPSLSSQQHIPHRGENGRSPNPVSARNGLHMEKRRKTVDIRMIDFNHSTCDAVKYSGPDSGYLLGLHSMINAFSLMAKSEP